MIRYAYFQFCSISAVLIGLASSAMLWLDRNPPNTDSSLFFVILLGSAFIGAIIGDFRRLGDNIFLHSLVSISFCGIAGFLLAPGLSATHNSRVLIFVESPFIAFPPMSMAAGCVIGSLLGPCLPSLRKNLNEWNENTLITSDTVDTGHE